MIEKSSHDNLSHLNRSKMQDIIIVGGGHVGLYLASELARSGYRVVVLDQKKTIGERIVCTGIVGAEAFRELDLPKETVLGAIQRIRFFSPRGTFFDFTPPQTLAYVVDRGGFNRFFASQALRSGAEIQTGSRVEGISVCGEKVEVKVAETDGRERSYEARALVLATGTQTRLFELAGLRGPERFLGGAQIHLPFPGEDRTSVYVGREVAPGAFAWVVPLQNGQARIGLLSEANPGGYLKKFLDRIRPGWREEAEEGRMDLRPVVARPVPRSYGNRVLVVGEAAGQIKTTTAGGIYYGFLGAQAAAETLRDAFERNCFDHRILSGYERAWKKRMGEELRFGYHCRALFRKFSDRHMEELFSDENVREEILNLVYRKADFDWHRNLVFSMLQLPSVFLHGLRHPLLASRLMAGLLFGRV